MIESGTHTPGVRVADFGLPPNTALRFEQPAPDLIDYISNYHVLDSEEPDGGTVDYVLPGWPTIRFVLDAPLALTLGDVTYDPLPRASLCGTTTRAMRVTVHGGVTIGVAITPLGWPRLFREPAHRLRDRVVPLQTVMDPALVDALVAQLAASDRGPAVKGVLDRFFAAHMGPPSRHEPQLRALMRLIQDDRTQDLTSAAQRIGIDPHRLRRLAMRYFGFAPKTLLMRTRFLRSFLTMHAASDRADYSRIASTYFDASHFLRDAKRFLGMTPRRFMALHTPYLDGTIRAYALVKAAWADRAKGPGNV